jgi:WD40 repeat protein
MNIRLILTGFVASAALYLIPATGSGGIIFVTNFANNTIGEYNATTGATINSSFISAGLDLPGGIALFGGNLFVANSGNDTIGVYNATTGATINSSFISSGLNGPIGIALSGGDLFVANSGNNTIGAYDATTGATIDSSFISSGLNVPVGIVVSSPSVPDASPTLILLLLGLTAIFGLKRLLPKPA